MRLSHLLRSVSSSFTSLHNLTLPLQPSSANRRELSLSSPLLAEMIDPHIDIEGFCRTPMPAPFWYLRHPDHVRWHLTLFHDVMNVGSFHHREGGVLYGGPSGARWLVLPVLRALHSLRTPSSRPPYVYTEHATSLDLLEPHLQDCVDLALDLVSTSVRTLQRSMAHRLNVQDTPLIFQAAACDRDSSPISDYDPVAHAGHSEYEEFYF